VLRVAGGHRGGEGGDGGVAEAGEVPHGHQALRRR
jgi:hypothetical protein